MPGIANALNITPVAPLSPSLGGTGTSTTIVQKIDFTTYIIRRLTATTTLTVDDFGKKIICNGTTGYTVTLPSPIGNEGKFIDFTIQTTSFAVVTLATPAGKIATQTTLVLGAGDSVRLWSDNANWLADSMTIQPVVLSASLTQAQSIPNNTVTPIKFNTVNTDTLGFYDASNGKFLPKLPGRYRIAVSGSYESVTLALGTVFQSFHVRKNGVIAAQTQWQVPLGLAVQQSQGKSITLYLNGSTDYVEGATSQTTGLAKSLVATAAFTYLSIERLSIF